MTIPAAALGETAVCTTCGAVYYSDQACPVCRLQAQVDELRKWITEQDEAWTDWRKARTAAAGGVPQPRRTSRTRPRPSRPVPGRPSLIGLPGGAA